MLNLPLDSPRARMAIAGLSKKQARRVRSILTQAQREADQRIARAERRTLEAQKRLSAATATARLAGQRLEAARAAAGEIFASAMAEALEVIAALPDFDALEKKKRGSRSALGIVREVCDAGGFSFAVIKGRHMSAAARDVQARAIGAVADAFPEMSAGEIGAMFGGMSKDRVRHILAGRGAA